MPAACEQVGFGALRVPCLRGGAPQFPPPTTTTTTTTSCWRA